MCIRDRLHRGETGRGRKGHQAVIYLDNAATTRPKPPGVAEAVVTAMESYGNSGRGVHEEAQMCIRDRLLMGLGVLNFMIW